MNHCVFFWLKPNLSAEDRATFESELLRLISIDYLVKGFTGKPADVEPRPVTDLSFSYSLVLQFKSTEDQNFYQNECPVHKRFIDTCKTFWERVIVYDSVPIS